MKGVTNVSRTKIVEEVGVPPRKVTYKMLGQLADTGGNVLKAAANSTN